MASTHFTTGTTITSEWLNDVNDAIYEGNITAEGVQYTPPFTGGVTETVEAKLAQIVSPKDFGAIGDGVADDTNAVQRALNVGGIIDLVGGTYLVAGVATALDGTTIRNGSLVAQAVGSMATRQVLLVQHDNVQVQNVNITVPNVSYTTGTAGLCIQAANNVTVIGGVFRGSREDNYNIDPRSSIQINSSINVIVDNAQVYDSAFEGIYLLGCTNCKITNCYTDNTQNSGIATGQGAGHLVSGNICKNTAAGGNISINCNNCVITNNITEGNGYGSGITAGHLSVGDYIRDVVISNNRVMNSTDDGILVVYPASATITGNVITACGGKGIFVQSLVDNITYEGSIVIDGNAIHSCATAGIECAINDQHDILISNNTFKQIGGIGVVCRTLGKTVITNNVMTNISSWALYCHGFYGNGASTGKMVKLEVDGNTVDRLHRGFLDCSNILNLVVTNNSVDGFGSLALTDAFIVVSNTDIYGVPQDLPVVVTIIGNDVSRSGAGMYFLMFPPAATASPPLTRILVNSNTTIAFTPDQVFYIPDTTRVRMYLRDNRWGFDKLNDVAVIPPSASTVTITNDNITTFSNIAFQQSGISPTRGLYALEPAVVITSNGTAEVRCGSANGGANNINLEYFIL